MGPKHCARCGNNNVVIHRPLVESDYSFGNEGRYYCGRCGMYVPVEDGTVPVAAAPASPLRSIAPALGVEPNRGRGVGPVAPGVLCPKCGIARLSDKPFEDEGRLAISCSVCGGNWVRDRDRFQEWRRPTQPANRGRVSRPCPICGVQVRRLTRHISKGHPDAPERQSGGQPQGSPSGLAVRKAEAERQSAAAQPATATSTVSASAVPAQDLFAQMRAQRAAEPAHPARFSTIPLSEARASTQAPALAVRREYRDYVRLLTPDTAGKLQLEPTERALLVRARLQAAAAAEGVALQTERRGRFVYFWLIED